MNVEIYKCFIASPGDTSDERSICDKVFYEINKTLGEQLGFRIESKKWENDARPSFGTDGQAVITKQLLDKYQLFIGIMWNRFGTPTKRAESGTEEEFLHAYKKFIDGDDVEIMLYFNDAEVKASTLDIDQLQKVNEFKEKVSSLGALYSNYVGSENFERLLRKHLNDYFVQKLSSRTGDPIIKGESEKLKKMALHESVLLVLKKRFDDALCLFTNQPIVWVDPVLSKTNEISRNADDNYNSKIELAELIRSPKSIIIKSPPQFGLTCLSHYLAKEAWNEGYFWVLLDTKSARRNSITSSVNRELKSLNIENRKIDCIVLDSWISHEHGATKLLKNLCAAYKSVPIVVMQTIDDSSFQYEESKEEIHREFEVLHLLAMPRTQIRKVVSTYNTQKNIGDDDAILDKVVKDLHVLNIHRTPLNCLTLLKVSENYFDESPVNRAKMLEMVLFVLFDLGELPTYKAKPDLKDCEYVLGRFCENLIRENNYEFTRDGFLKDLELFCKEKLIYLEVSVVFDILFANSIIMKRNSSFVFRASYWIYYFAAKRMFLDKEFCDYIIFEKKYVSFPEIIEFYTGIDRNRTDLLDTLTQDISCTCDEVERKTGLSKGINPFHSVQWNPSESDLRKMKDEVSNDVKNSNLPEIVKDQYADRSYNQLRPYDQSIHDILQEYSLAILIQKIRACSRALRNSDYVNPTIKKKMMKEITRAWEQVSIVILALTPMLAARGYAACEGQGFQLNDHFGNTLEERINRIFQVTPFNVVNTFKDDLSSDKLGPLIFDAIKSEKHELIKHLLVLLIISERPSGWNKHVEYYIESVLNDSFYLYDTVNALRTKYRYSFSSDKELHQISYLLKMGYAKNEFGVKKPRLDSISRISNRVLPKRDIGES